MVSICFLFQSTRVALDHLESVPEKLSLLEGFKDFRVRKSWLVSFNILIWVRTLDIFLMCKENCREGGKTKKHWDVSHSIISEIIDICNIRFKIMGHILVQYGEIETFTLLLEAHLALRNFNYDLEILAN